ncbi:Deoxycytidine monophosphate (dCMP) deaminase [Entomophthora muscae]|uniref:Deoxycytidine monophosphate (dCMP) deaminase n=1 Tax=Entomophthora muscae TaxID=34485 RepID=A0ACC2TD10_9FUNG|nr:Deoxycytidine monophosphate (dCMP) deaminase [Entomophthora muscae]
MFIGLIGPICSGKSSIANYLVTKKGFSLVGLSCNPGADELKEGVICEEGGEKIRRFQSLDSLLNYVTSNWGGNFVVKDKLNYASIVALRKRPFFLLVATSSPLSMRYSRWLGVSVDTSPPKGLHRFEEFIQADDAQLFASANTNSSLSDLVSYADLTVLNNHPTLEEFWKSLDLIDLTNPERIRPSWDSYFMLLTELACLRSNCMKRRVGCLVVKDNRVIATGYNGTPRNVLNCSEGGCPRCNSNSVMGQDLDICLCIHAEENALLEAGRERISGGHAILYCNTCPCIGCAKKIVQVGVKEVVYSQAYRMDQQTLQLFKSANILLRRFIPSSIKLHISASPS